MTRPIPILWTCDVRTGHQHETAGDAQACINRRTVASPLGWCPVPGCDKRGCQRGVVHEGYDLADESYDECEAGHRYPSAKALPGEGR